MLHKSMSNRATNSKSARILAVAMVVGTLAMASVANVTAQQATQALQSNIDISVGRGQLINLPSAMTDVFVANDQIADVQVRSARQLYVFGKGPGETSIIATNAQGRAIYSVIAKVGNNIETVGQMLELAMPDATISARTLNGFILLTGTVQSPASVAEAESLVQAFVGEDTRVLSRLRTATPLQVSLQVRISEVSRTLVKELRGNILTREAMGSGFLGGVAIGRDVGSIRDATLPTAMFPDINPTVPLPYDPTTGRPVLGQPPVSFVVNRPESARTLYGAGRLFGLNILGALDWGERAGYVTTLAQPNLTAISGETAEFLAGGEFPIPVPDEGRVTIEYRRFGVSLAYTPTVLSNNRISLRVRPEVSELSAEGSITMQGFEIPSLVVRRAETTVELGSGESFMIAGLMSNRSTGTLDKLPGLGDIPLLGTLFKSDEFRRGETELVIVVTPYLVKPTPASDILLPTDAYQNTSDFSRILLGQVNSGEKGGERPKPKLYTNSDDASRRESSEEFKPGFNLK